MEEKTRVSQRNSGGGNNYYVDHLLRNWKYQDKNQVSMAGNKFRIQIIFCDNSNFRVIIVNEYVQLSPIINDKPL